MKLDSDLIALVQTIGTLLVAGAVSALTLVEAGVIPSKRLTVKSCGSTGLSSLDSINVNVENWPRGISADISNIHPISVEVEGVVSTYGGRN